MADTIRSLGIDPGSKVIAWALLDVTRSAATWLDGGSFEIGRIVDDPIRRAAGKRAEREITDHDLALLDVDLRHALRSVDFTGPRLQCYVERPRKIIATRPGAVSGVGISLWLGGEVRRTVQQFQRDARLDAPPVETVDPFEWRQALGLGRGPKDAEVAAALKQRISGMPERNNNHVRDAAGVALVGARRTMMGLEVAR